MGIKERLRRFFAGRNGMDALSNALSWGSILVMLLSVFLPSNWIRAVLYYGALIGLFYAYFRVFSRNLGKRQRENQAFLSWKGQCRQRWQQRKTHKFYRCPRCKTVLRVPKGKGKISITCRSCGERFIRKT